MDVDFDLTTHRGCWETLISSCADGPSLVSAKRVLGNSCLLRVITSLGGSDSLRLFSDSLMRCL